MLKTGWKKGEGALAGLTKPAQGLRRLTIKPLPPTNCDTGVPLDPTSSLDLSAAALGANLEP